MARLREDDRFKSVGPDAVVLPYPTSAHLQHGLKTEPVNEGEIWFDWAFVDFWKSNYCELSFPFCGSLLTGWVRHCPEGVVHGT
jgi:hypothetical protein